MLSVKALAAGGDAYYARMVSGYYLHEDGQEPAGIWFGRGAPEFGLEPGSAVRRDHLERLAWGFDPHSPEKKLVWNAGRTDGHAPRSPGVDLTLSAPKSVSIFWALSNEETQRRLEKLVLSAARQTLSYVEDYCGFARVGKGGLARDQVPLTFALFPQSSSRENDMQLHIHCLLLNITRHADGRTTAIDPTTVFDHQFAAGSLFNVALAHGLRKEFGLELVAKQTGAFLNYEIKGISEAAIEHYSKRKAQIDEAVERRGGTRDTSSAQMKQVACLETRKGKEERPRGELIGAWRREAAELFGLTPGFMRLLEGKSREPTREEKAELRELCFRKGVAGLEEQHSHWSLADLHQRVAEHAQLTVLGVSDMREVIASKLRGPELEILGEVRTGQRNNGVQPGEEPGRKIRPNLYADRYEMRITSPAVRQAERQLLGAAERLAATRSECPVEHVERAIGNRPTIAKEQAEAVRYLTSGPNLRLMTGDAGTGKSFTMAACREAWEAEGRTVLGCAIAGKAAKQLEAEAGIKSGTLKSLLYRLDNGMARLGSRHVIVCDEAAMVGTRMSAALVKHCEEAGAKLVLLGDAKQVQSIEAGGAFRSLSERLGETRLREIRRQEEVWRRETVRDFGEGNARRALGEYLRRGQLHVEKNRDEAMQKLVSKWVADGGRERPDRVLMLASLNSEVDRLNKAAQSHRAELGLLGPRKVDLGPGVEVRENDRVRFCEKTKKFGGIENGWTGTVEAVDEEKARITVRLDVGRTVTVSLSEYKAEKIKLCYASTVFSSQGTTVDAAHVLLGGPLSNRHTTLVAASRCRQSCHLIIDVPNAGPHLKDAVRQLSRDRTKTLAQDVADLHQRQLQEQQRLVAEQGQRLLPPQQQARGISLSR